MSILSVLFKQMVIVVFLLSFVRALAQETLVKSFSSNKNSIEIATDGLDEIKIINSNNQQIEVSLFEENLHSHHILINNESSILKISFKLELVEAPKVFKKFITKRLNRASVVVKLPKDKSLTILGTNIDVISENYHGNLYVYIDKGFINLNEVQQNAKLKLFQGTVLATVSNSSVDIQSSKGKITVNEKVYAKKYQKTIENSSKYFQVSSINANVSCILKR